jgi:transposase
MEGNSSKFLAELPEEDWAKTPESVKKLVAILVERIASGERQIAALQEGQDHLQEQVQRNSRNSSQPPSQDASKGLKAKPKKKSVKPRGAQLGHEGHQQELYPPEQCEDIKDYYPAQCCECGQELSGEDAAPQRCQVVEIPPLRAIVIEHRFHALSCPCCGVTTRAYDREIVDGSRYGERLCALVGVLSGEYRQSHRMVVRLLAVQLSTDVSNAQAPRV